LKAWASRAPRNARGATGGRPGTVTNAEYEAIKKAWAD
jgi:hypothetical protein